MVFRAIADATRREILVILAEGERSVQDLAAEFDVSRPAVSKHLAVLLRAGLVSERREGRNRCYALTPGPLADVVDYVATFDRYWTDRLDDLGRHLDADAEPDGEQRGPADLP